MTTRLSRRLRRLEEQLPPAHERMKVEINFICPVTKEVVDSIVVELGDYIDQAWRRNSDRSRYTAKSLPIM